MRISDWSSDVCSSDLRTNTTVLSTYVHPITQRYIERLEDQLKDGGYEKPLYMMQSNGGIATAKAAKANPIAMVESGPASGIFAAAYMRSEEHTSELQSLMRISYAVFCLKKKKRTKSNNKH